ncbi:MAG: MarR family transcriptional regulator [Clostridia bacterium]|nr:MarR family transcriptional regulator [Clostridia bacterium]
MEKSEYDALKLDNQLCFPLYAAAREVVKKYRPFLDELDLTYTQYIAMMVMWEHEQITVKELGEKLYLDSGTVTPVVKSLIAKGHVQKQRNQADERSVIVSLTEQGRTLRKFAADVPHRVADCISLDPSEAVQLYTLLYKVLKS